MAVVAAMGLFDFLTGNADPDPSRPRLAAAELRDRLLALGDPAGRWQVRAAVDEGGAELVAEWNLIDARVIDWVRAAGARATKRVLMRLDETTGTVRSVDHDGSLLWAADVGGLRFEAAAFRGQSRQIGKSWTLGGGAQDAVSWDTDEIKRPLRQTVADAGWGWHGVAFAKL